MDALDGQRVEVRRHPSARTPHAPRHTERGALCPAECTTSRSATPSVCPDATRTRHTEQGVLCPAECTTSRSATPSLCPDAIRTRHTERGALRPAECTTSRSATPSLCPHAPQLCHTERGALCTAGCTTSRSATQPAARTPHAPVTLSEELYVPLSARRVEVRRHPLGSTSCFDSWR